MVDFIRQLGGLDVLDFQNSGAGLDDDEYFPVEIYLGTTKILKDVSPVINFDVRVDDTNSTVNIISVRERKWILPGIVYCKFDITFYAKDDKITQSSISKVSVGYGLGMCCGQLRSHSLKPGGWA